MAKNHTSANKILPENGVWPKTSPRYTKSFAEDKLYKIIKAQLPNGWYAWHSLSVRLDKNGNLGQTDFVLAVPNRPAILLIEVKGGIIEQKDGQWLQNGQRLLTPPLEQTLNFKNKFIARLKEKGLTEKQIPSIGLAFCFPDNFFSNQPNQDGMKGVTFGGEILPYFCEAIRYIVGNAVPFPKQVLNDEWINVIHEIWGESWSADLDISSRIKYEKSKRIKLDREQILVLESLDDDFGRIIVNGHAGTGKTLLACETAIKKAKRGERVLLACYTEALGALLEKTTQHPNITAGPIRQFAIKLLKNAGQNIKIENSKEFWDTISLKAAVDGLPPISDRWDYVIIDEGQDLTSDDWDLVRECAQKTDKILVFADETQSFWNDRCIPQIGPQKWYKHNLGTAYRCPQPIQNLTDCYAGYCDMNVKVIKEGMQDNVIKLIESTERDLCETIQKEITFLTSNNIKPNQIAIVSIRGMNDPNNIMHKTNLFSKVNVVTATDRNADKEIICDTFLRFKGLQRPVIIVTDLRLVSSKFYDIRMHLAISRSQGLIRIVTGRDEFEKDGRLSIFVS